MLRWTVELEGGPKRVNHAAVAIGDRIYSFGGYCTGVNYETTTPMDVHVLDTGKCQNVNETTTPMDVHVVDTGKCKNVYETTTLMDVHVLDTG